MAGRSGSETRKRHRLRTLRFTADEDAAIAQMAAPLTRMALVSVIIVVIMMIVGAARNRTQNTSRGTRRADASVLAGRCLRQASGS
jgi:hypothetical protein